MIKLVVSVYKYAQQRHMHEHSSPVVPHPSRTASSFRVRAPGGFGPGTPVRSGLTSRFWDLQGVQHIVSENLDPAFAVNNQFFEFLCSHGIGSWIFWLVWENRSDQLVHNIRVEFYTPILYAQQCLDFSLGNIAIVVTVRDIDKYVGDRSGISILHFPDEHDILRVSHMSAVICIDEVENSFRDVLWQIVLFLKGNQVHMDRIGDFLGELFKFVLGAVTFGTCAD